MSTFDIENLCKLCLNVCNLEGSLSELEINNTPVLSIIEKIIYKLDWSEVVIFPDKICSECLQIVQSVHQLNEKCLESDTQLRRLLATDDDGEIIIEEIAAVVTGDVGQDGKRPSETRAAQETRTAKLEADKSSPLKLMTQHLKIHVDETAPITCQQSETDSSLMRHEIIHSSSTTIKINEEEQIECVVCAKQFTLGEALAAHMKLHENDSEFRCSSCTVKFSELNELTSHIKLQHRSEKNKSHKCLICAKTFGQRSHLIDHLNRHNNLRPHVCQICNKAFQQSSTLKDHIRTHTSEKPFLCYECGKSFNNPSNLRQHVKRHSNLKEFHCQLCPGQFSSKAALEGHVRSHNGIKPHQCSICGSSFTKGSSLKKHVRSIHEKIKPYECEVCSMRFHSSEHLKRHTRIHTGDRPYVCDFNGCRKSYAQSNDLLKHKKTHLGDEVYKCTLCDEAFRLQVQLREHYRVHYVSSSGGDDSKTLTVQ